VEKLLTPAEVAEILQCSPATVRNMVTSGRLPSVNIGTGTKRRMYRIPEEAVKSLPGYSVEQGLVGLPRVNVEPLHPSIARAMAKAGK
jgi:excisionase family DNA binding protein